MIKIRVPGPKSAHFLRPPARTHWLPTVALSGAMAKSNSAGKKPMGSGMQQTTLVARRSVVSPSNGSPKSDQLGLGGKKNGKKKKAPTHKKMCLTPYYPTAARRAYLVVPEIGVLKWLLEIRKNGSVNLEINGRF